MTWSKIVANFASTCKCGTSIARGDPIGYDRIDGKGVAICIACYSKKPDNEKQEGKEPSTRGHPRSVNGESLLGDTPIAIDKKCMICDRSAAVKTLRGGTGHEVAVCGICYNLRYRLERMADFYLLELGSAIPDPSDGDKK